MTSTSPLSRLAVLLALASMAMAVDLPRLDWVERSDWINVKTDVTPRAVGNGIADDTAAIRAALALVNDDLEEMATAARPKVIYLPPGTYKVTGTLDLLNSTGVGLVGHGRETTIAWYGAAGGTIFRTSGVSYGWYNGIIWDGRGIAANGFLHQSAAIYETGIRHENESFIRCTEAGLRMQHTDSGQASADSMIRNCLFSGNYVGIYCGNYNVYAWVIEGCEFFANARGVQVGKGNAFIRGCHFAGNTERDTMTELTPTSTITRCTSIGSRRFYGGNYEIVRENGMTPIRDCQISGWTDPTAAIESCGTNLIADCVFTNPPSTNPPILYTDSNRLVGPNHLVVGRNVSAGTTGLVRNTNAVDGRITTIPAGSRSRNLTSAGTRFFDEHVNAGGTVVDAKALGAVADGATDDSAAVQACIDQARTLGNGAVAYFPAGDYGITRIITVTGGNYRIEGAGAMSRFRSNGTVGDGSCLFRVTDPQGIVITNINIVPNNSQQDALIQTSSSATSSITYDRVIFHDYSGLFTRGLRLQNLAAGSRTHIIQAYCPLHLIDAARGQVLVNYLGGTLQIQGTSTLRDGFLGVLTLEGLLDIRDNHSAVINEQYIEAQDQFIHASGSAGAAPGRITFGAGGPHWTNYTYNHGGTDPRVALIDNYRGRMVWGCTGPANKNPAGNGRFVHTGTNTIDLVEINDLVCRDKILTNGDFIYELGPNASLSRIARMLATNDLHPVTGDWWHEILPDSIAANGLQVVADSWDDLHELGALDLAWNYPHRYDTNDSTAPATPAAPTSSSLSSATPTLSGTTEAGAAVRIYDNGALIGTVTANGSGAWTWTASPALAMGSHALTVTATDAAGNASGASPATTVTVTTGNAAPALVNPAGATPSLLVAP